MSDNTGIEWTDATWNPVRGCSRVSEGCRNCYAETVAVRFSDQGAPYHGFAERGRPGSKWTGRVEIVEHMLDQPLRWKKPRRIFVNSMSDLFHEALPDEAIDRVFAVMALAPQHTFQVLTKRPERMLGYLHARNGMGNAALCRAINLIPYWMGNRRGALEMPLPNAWLGVSVENQAAADERIPLLLQTPASVRFLSCEPLLGPLNLEAYLVDLESGDGIDWVIVGGESGPGARIMEVEWARSIRDQCAFFRKPLFHKQNGEWQPGDGDTPHGQQYYKVGKKAAGSRLDGVEHKEFPR